MVRVIVLEGPVPAVAELLAAVCRPATGVVEVSKPPHVHHYVFESPNGPTSVGHCDCGAETVGVNSLEAEGSLPQAHRRPGRPRKEA